jgi:hypothetical protein
MRRGRERAEMNRERRAVVAFALLAALVLGPVAVTSHHGSKSEAAQAAGRPAARSAPEPRAAGSTGNRHPRFPNRKGPTPELSVCGISVPLYPGARSGGTVGNESRMLEVLTRLGLTHPLTKVRTFAIPDGDWIGNARTPEDVFQFYQHRMNEVPIFRMGRELRSLIGVRPTGEVDSPPLLYVDESTAVVIRTLGKSEVGLLVAAGCSRTV